MGRVTPPPRKTRFRLLAELCRAGFVNPQGCYERFPSSSLFPLSRACLTLLILILILIPMLIPILKLCLFSVLCPWCPDNRGQIIWYESLEDENVRTDRMEVRFLSIPPFD